MQVTFPSSEEFNIEDGVVADVPATLVTPNHIGVKWNKHNIIFRSSLWTKEGFPISLGWKKFVNFGELPALFPPPKTLSQVNLLEKLDGSLLCASWFRQHLVLRTRGTFSAELHETGIELPVLRNKYPQAFDSSFLKEEQHTLLFEWVGRNKIVINYGEEPDIYLIGGIVHADYSYLPQYKLDDLSKIIGVKRPKVFNFNTIEEMLKAVEAFKGVEGTCVYYNKDQNILKVKSAWYLALHRFKEHCNLEAILDLYLEYGMPAYSNFIVYIEKAFDFECLQLALPFASKICDAMKEVRQIVEHMQAFVEGLQGKSRKEQALKIMEAYGKTNRASFVFTLLDGKSFEKKEYKKLLFQCIK